MIRLGKYFTKSDNEYVCEYCDFSGNKGELLSHHKENYKDRCSNRFDSVQIPELMYKKIIRDPLHGYIQLTNVEYELLQLPALNRLHNIHHMGMGYLVYPGAKTSRFEHSLGVMNIASKMVRQIFQSASGEIVKDIFGLDPKKTERFEKRCRELIQIVRLAALLHDVGHGPYSHTTEGILQKAIEREVANGNTDIEEEADSWFGKEVSNKDFPAHEYFSCKMIDSDDSDIKRVIEDSLGENGTICVAGLLMDKMIPPQDRIPEKGIRFLKKIISWHFDADRMDYLLRDAYATGVSFGLTDIERIIMHLLIVEDKQGEKELAIDEHALMCIEDMIDARFKMYKWVYNHHLKVAFEELMERAIESLIDKDLKWEDFLWTAFQKGQTDDAYISYQLFKNQKDWFKGLFDRRYAPISLFKRPEDHKDFEEEIKSKMGRDMDNNIIVREIGKYLKGNEESEREPSNES